ncbi:MAG TPA: ATP-binding protein [Nitrospiraceae bacterium]|nr:ATP-binding protein [Nitrospiraceae bacterium]
MNRAVKFFNNLPIGRKLLLASVVPILALTLLSVVTYRSVETFSTDEEILDSTYLTQKKAAEYMHLIVDVETGFRGYALTQQEIFLEPYFKAHNRIFVVGDSLAQMVSDREEQHRLIQHVQQLVSFQMTEKDRLVQAIMRGRQQEALHYIEESRGRMAMATIREQMDRFNRLEQTILNDALMKSSQDRSSMLSVILGGGVLALVFVTLTLHVIARSITGPLINLAKVVGASSFGSIPDVPVLEREDEIGALTRVMHAMGDQIRGHLVTVEKSETELRELNRELSSSESKYRSLVDHAPFGIFTTEGMALVFTNRHNRILAGLNPDEEGDPEAIRQSIHPEDRHRVLSEFEQAVKQGQPYETVFRFLHKDGTVRKVLSRRIPIRDKTGAVIRYQGFNVDITALDQLQARLSRAERLATLGQVAAGIAHEIRNPLVGIGSTTSLLLEDTDRSNPHHAELEVILRETKRLDRIVNQIIDYARPRSLALATFPLQDLVQEVQKLLDAPIAVKHLTVTGSLPPTLSHLQADRDQLKQVLLNLIQNSIEASTDGGALTLTAFELSRGKDPGIVITITDMGSGISPEDLPHIFEPFFTSGKHRGTGLGLAICRNIIEAHGGDIHLANRSGKGTTARIWLPLRQQPKMAEA